MRQMRKHESKFKVGDKVKNIWNENVYTVTSVMDTGYMLDDRYLPFDDEMCWMLAGEPKQSKPLEVTELENKVLKPKFKVGDRVKRKVVDPHNPATRYIYTVFEIENDKYCLDHNDHESWIPISAQNEFELVNEPEPKHKFNIGDIIKHVFSDIPYFVYEIKDNTYRVHQYKNGNDEETIPFDDEDMWERVAKKLECTVPLEHRNTDIDEIWKKTLVNMINDITKRNTESFIYIIDETLRFMDCGAYDEHATNGMRIFAKELKKRLGYDIQDSK